MTQPMLFEEIRAGIFVARGGFAIRRDTNEIPAYWIAYRPDEHGRVSLAPAYELGAGAGDQGWAKCVRLCEANRALLDCSNYPPLKQSTGNPTTTPGESNSNNNEPPQQRGLEL